MAADNEVIVHLDADRARRRDDLARDGDVGGAGLGIAAGVVVHEDQGRGRELERAARDLAGIDGRVIDRAFVHHFVGDELVLHVEEEHAELFARFVRHGEAAVVDQLRPRADDSALLELALAARSNSGL